MTARILDGAALARTLTDEVRAERGAPAGAGAAARPGRAAGGRQPRLGGVRARARPAPARSWACITRPRRLPAPATTAEVAAVVREYNARAGHPRHPRAAPPAPAGRRRSACSTSWIPRKDVDGFHPENVGPPGAEAAALRPLHARSGSWSCCGGAASRSAGRRAVVLGRSDIVGKPMALLLLHADATVTVCHSRTRDLAAVTREADVLVAAIGRPGLRAGAST